MKQKQPFGKPIGKQIPAVLECLARIGPSTARQIAVAAEMDPRAVSKLLKRCEYRELTRVEEDGDRRIHRVALGWKDRLEARDWRPDPKPSDMPPRFKTPAVNSVFAMGA